MAGSQISLNTILRRWAMEKWPSAYVLETSDWWSLRVGASNNEWAVAQVTLKGLDYRAVVDYAANPFNSLRGAVWKHENLSPTDREYFVKLEDRLNFAISNTIEQMKVRRRYERTTHDT